MWGSSNYKNYEGDHLLLGCFDILERDDEKLGSFRRQLKAKYESQSISLVAYQEALISQSGRADTAEQHPGALIVEYQNFEDSLDAYPGQVCYANDPAWEELRPWNMG